MLQQRSCDKKAAGGCGRWDYFQHFLPTVPPIFKMEVGSNESESSDEIINMLSDLPSEINDTDLYGCRNLKTMHRLVSMAMDSLEDVVAVYRGKGFRPQFLFFEAAE
ncbi:hypothetical protein AKJ16_DCAP02503 [Drosera capensis]